MYIFVAIEGRWR